MREFRRCRAAVWVWVPAAVVLALMGGRALVAQSDGMLGSVTLSIELPDNPMAGARLFVEKRCVQCHALGGEETRLGPDLGRIHFRGSVMDLAAAFWNHASVMREKMRDLKIQPPRLNGREMADLVAFLAAYHFYLDEAGQLGNPSAGKALFAAKGCVRCHGSDAPSRPGADLRHIRGRFSAVSIWKHGPQAQWPKLSGRETADLVAFLQEAGDRTADERAYVEPGSPRRGRELFASKGCAACHSVAGRGGRPGLDLAGRRPALTGSIWELAGLMGSHRSVPRASDQEMADILAYLYFINYANVRGVPKLGGQLFEAKCSPCHTLGGGKKVGPDLATVPELSDPLAIIAAMWEHAPTMEQEMRDRNIPRPHFEPGDAADLTAFLLSKRTPSGENAK